LSKDLHDAFATTGFAYLANAPLSFNHEDVFNLASEFFSLLSTEKMRLAKQTFCDENKNTYRGYFPTQPGQQDNLKEGVRSVPKTPPTSTPVHSQTQVRPGRTYVWPLNPSFAPQRECLESLYAELQLLSSTPLSLLAVSLNKPANHFAHYLKDSLSTLRLLHYPPQQSASAKPTDKEPKLC
jgi:isopenicillin N synthase-like dioxygenase